jgi:beta-galactosidase/beta-glucuronidase
VPLKRRSVLIAGALTPVAATSALHLDAAAGAAEPAGRPAPAFTGRATDLGDGWRFALANPTGIADPTGQYADAANPDYDDSAWRTVDLPHDWSIELDPVQAPDTNGGTGFFHGGLGWYRKQLALPASLAGKRISIEFDGVYMDSAVYLNGALVGSHAYGYTGFSIDLTGLVHTDGTTADVLAVKVQNQLPSSRWYSGSGIYRNVRLVVTEPVHVKRWGTFVTTPDLATEFPAGLASAPELVSVRVETAIANETGAPVQVLVRNTVLDTGGHQAGRADSTVAVPPEGATSTSTVEVRGPRLWSVEQPDLYTLRTELIVDDRVVDTYLTTFGLRYFRFDPDNGLFLNGEHMKLRGVDLHHDQGALGAAIHEDAILRQMTLMKSMGVNAFRTSHNPPSPEMIRVCERLGIVMMVEAFDCWQRGKNPFDYGRFFVANSDADITEMVLAARNSPAVLMYSIGNEIPDSTSTAGLGMAQRLIDDIRAVDTTRAIVIGSDRYRGLPAAGSPADLMLAKLDGLGLNYNTAASVDALHARYPRLFLFESESSSETSTRGVYQEPEHLNTGENLTPGRRGVSSYDNNLASWTMSGEYGHKKDRDREFFAGQFLWSGIDYIGEPTPYGVFPVKASFFGAMDTAGFAKDMYHLFRSQWTDEPLVHLLPMNWTDHEPGETVQVWAYSNVESVELYLNGRSLGVRAFDRKTTTYGLDYLETTEATHDDKTVTGGAFPGSYTSPNGSAGKLHLTWDVPFERGTLTAVARTSDGTEVARDELRSAGAPFAIRLTANRDVIPADRRSLAFVTVEVVDNHGVLVPGATDTIGFTVTGGVLAGTDNGRQESAENYQSPSRAAWGGKALAILRSTGEAGPVTITATAPGLVPASATVIATSLPDSLGATGDGLIAALPVTLRVGAGQRARLPETVIAVRADGARQELPVHWAGVPARLDDEPGVYRISGAVPHLSGSLGGLPARATVTVVAPSTVETYSVAVPVGVTPALPRTLRVVYTDGVSQYSPVVWQPVPTSQFDAPGVVTLTGTIAGVQIPATATVRVTDEVSAAQNLVAVAGLHPAADASYSGAGNTLPAAMLDGSATTAWSNSFTKVATALLPSFNGARPADWIAAGWPNPQRTGDLTVTFVADARRALPAGIQVSYWDGLGFAAVRGQSVTFTGNVATIAFEPVTTTQLRLVLTSAQPGTPAGAVGVTSLVVTGDAVAYQEMAALNSLSVDGRPVPGFDPSIVDYTVALPARGEGVPPVGAVAAQNGRLLIVPPAELPGTATVTVTAEDGVTQQVYRVRLARLPAAR